jgi:hypothetical protein
MKRDPRLVRLSWDHHHGLVLSRRILHEAPGATDGELAALYSAVVAEWSRAILPHFHAEGECLLARLIRHGEARPLVEQTSADHVAIQGLVADMRDATTLAERAAAMLTFAERLRAHIRWEEAELFQRSQETMTGPELDAMAAEVEEILGPEVN